MEVDEAQVMLSAMRGVHGRFLCLAHPNYLANVASSWHNTCNTGSMLAAQMMSQHCEDLNERPESLRLHTSRTPNAAAVRSSAPLFDLDCTSCISKMASAVGEPLLLPLDEHSRAMACSGLSFRVLGAPQH